MKDGTATARIGGLIYEGTIKQVTMIPMTTWSGFDSDKFEEVTLTMETKKRNREKTAKIETSDGFVYEGVVESCVLEPNPYQTKQGLTVRLYPCKITYPTPKQIREGVIDECLAAICNMGYDPEWTPGAVKGFVADAIRKLR